MNVRCPQALTPLFAILFLPVLGVLEKGAQPPPVFLPGEVHGQSSLVGSSPCSCKESDATELVTQVNTSSAVQ